MDRPISSCIRGPGAVVLCRQGGIAVSMREKVKHITAAVKEGESVPESSKRAGMVVLYLIFGAGLFLLLALTAGLIQSGHYIGSAVVLLGVGALGFVLLNVIRA